MKFYVDYFGCRTNQAEMQEWIVELETSGYKLTNDLTEADFGILNTCSVTERAEKDIFKFISKAFQNTNIPWFIVGCTVSKEKKSLQERYKNYFFFDNTEKVQLIDFIKEKFPVEEENVIYHSSFKSRIFLKIHEGCNFRCSYCIVPFLRGKARSTPSAEIMHKARYFASLGYKEIVLTGVNLSSYGYDLFPRENLLNLVKQLCKIRGVDFIRLSTLDPRYLRYEFVKELSYLRKIAISFHFSFQSGSNQVLQRMKRGSKVFEYHKILELFRDFFPWANLGADLLIGFPGETDREFQETLEFFRDSPLNYAHIFPFSPREGTKAALMEQVPVNIVQKRVKEMKEINRAKKLQYRERFLEKTVEGILTEEDPNYSLVVTTNYLSVRVPPVMGFKKKKVKVRIHQVVNENMCEGTIVKR
ncbi:MAG: MiaB/RimO family radical SAM methylthiotransferase [Acidobacteria bacterium]|jgi:threonylcarbamoyladenosine tRNA methylthiotransferase MtaB|nr:MiaB/RimO family radical SAM methylthiotransferase [Acidobacteriota bacterium]